MDKSNSKLHLNIAIGFVVFFGLLFLQFPIQQSIGGKVDSLFFVTAYNTIGNWFLSLFSNSSYGNSLFPEAAVYPFGNYSWGGALFYLPFKFLGMPDYLAWYFFLTLVYSTNAFAAFVLCKHFIWSIPLRIFAAFTFASSNFALASMDNPDTLFFFLPLLSISLFLDYFTFSKKRYLIATVVLGGLSVYWSSYLFLFQSLSLAIIGFANWKKWFYNKKCLFQLLIYCPFYIILILPYLNIYVFEAEIHKAWNPAFNPIASLAASLNPNDLYRFLTNNLVYPSLNDLGINWLSKTRSAGIGFLIYILALIGSQKFLKTKKWVLVSILIFFVLALGPGITIGDKFIPMPMYPFYNYLGLSSYLRIPVRAFLFCSLWLSILAAIGLGKLSSLLPKYRLSLIAAAFFVVALENIPFPLLSHRILYENPIPIKLAKFLNEEKSKGNAQKPKNIAHLPSSFFSGYYPDFPKTCEGQDSEWEFIREYLYMNWQTKHKESIINGFTGFIPNSRISNQLLLQDLSKADNLNHLLERNNLNYIVYHKNLMLECENQNFSKFLYSSPLLNLELDTDDLAIFSPR